jgi:hypothetical protein
MATIRSIGLPENDSERKAINYLKENLPDDYLIFTNMELPTRNGLPYEYDIVVVGEYAVYSIEVKGYRGEIKGNAFEWELDSGVIYKSPIPLSNKKAKIIGDRLKNYMPILEKVWVQSLILLTDDNARIKLNDPQSNRVLRLKEVKDYLLDPRQLQVSTGPIGRLKSLIVDAIAGQFKPLHRSHDVGDYRVIETVGKNNLHTTLLAQHKLLQINNLFLLKVYSFNVYDSPESQAKQRDWILRDATALLKLNRHNNIVQAYPPFAWLDNQIVLPVEWADGYSLKGLLAANEKIDFHRKLDIIQQLFDAIKFAHENNIIHRDIRPENIIIPKNGPVKLVNFDCAHFEDNNMRTIATRVGKHLDERYVAPEVWNNPGSVIFASDIYALGVVLFEMLVGRTPYQKIREVFEKKALPFLPSHLDNSLPVEADEIISGMCAFNPSERMKLPDLIDLINILR